MDSISDSLIEGYIHDFFGYGNLNSPYWFIGKEEGGGSTPEENISRIRIWEMNGKPQTHDYYLFHKQLGFSDHQLSRLQQTWTKLSQILRILTTGSDFSSKEDTRSFLLHNFGRYSGNHCLLELMPIPARSTDKSRWMGQLICSHPNLIDRDIYKKKYISQRIESIKLLIAQYNPKLVVFYSTEPDYINAWTDITGKDRWNKQTLDTGINIAYQQNERLYIICPHPTRPGIKSTDFPSISYKVVNLLNKSI